MSHLDIICNSRTNKVTDFGVLVDIKLSGFYRVFLVIIYNPNLIYVNDEYQTRAKPRIVEFADLFLVLVEFTVIGRGFGFINLGVLICF